MELHFAAPCLTICSAAFGVALFKQKRNLYVYLPYEQGSKPRAYVLAFHRRRKFCLFTVVRFDANVPHSNIPKITEWKDSEGIPIAHGRADGTIPDVKIPEPSPYSNTT
jgi:hypothetical protein